MWAELRIFEFHLTTDILKTIDSDCIPLFHHLFFHVFRLYSSIQSFSPILLTFCVHIYMSNCCGGGGADVLWQRRRKSAKRRPVVEAKAPPWRFVKIHWRFVAVAV